MTFALIHSKQRNCLIQRRLNDLVYVHYNLRLRLKCIKEVKLKYLNSITNQFVHDDEDPMIKWLVGQELEVELYDP